MKPYDTKGLMKDCIHSIWNGAETSDVKLVWKLMKPSWKYIVGKYMFRGKQLGLNTIILKRNIQIHLSECESSGSDLFVVIETGKLLI